VLFFVNIHCWLTLLSSFSFIPVQHCCESSSRVVVLLIVLVLVVLGLGFFLFFAFFVVVGHSAADVFFDRISTSMCYLFVWAFLLCSCADDFGTQGVGGRRVVCTDHSTPYKCIS